MRFLAAGLVLAWCSMANVTSASAQSAPPPGPSQTVPAPSPSQWHAGEPVPPFYHVEDQPRSGLVVAGVITLGVPYFFSAVAALSASSQNESGWLYAPVAGPWLTLGRRAYSCNADANNQTTSQSLGCVADIFVVMGLVFDGIVQATGATLLLVGVLDTKPGLARDESALRVVPLRLGSGVGAGVVGQF